MGQLITALTSGLQIGTPKISTFSGDVAPGKTKVSYKQWSHEVYKGPLSRVSGQRKYHAVSEMFGNIWHSHVSQCTNAKFL